MTIRALLPTFLLSFLLASCADNWLVASGEDTNYLTFHHPNSEKAIAEVRARAEETCRQRKQPAIRTASVCSLTNCTTDYQCVDNPEASKSGL
ncbi:MAG: hypothetical protein H6942_10570 [Candidatus Accumulibacter sp.]|uniref:hypothetical protein n=1 Tax=Accumulibacter sp. TaxID=2053492 RepID=UPI001D784009|nr:hypothetical protein [Accumulibacter sp.]MCB1942984.1 hypothetical protein [Accumulibacter sp.]MCP5248957.1 hypothetical protein [Accumulibacter sp.]